LPRLLVDLPTLRQDVGLATEVAIVGGDEADRAVEVLGVVPGEEAVDQPWAFCTLTKGWLNRGYVLTLLQGSRTSRSGVFLDSRPS